MFNYKIPDNPKAGDIYFDPINEMWRVFNGKTWVDVNLREHKCSLSLEQIMFGKTLNDEEPIQD